MAIHSTLGTTGSGNTSLVCTNHGPLGHEPIAGQYRSAYKPLHNHNFVSIPALQHSHSTRTQLEIHQQQQQQ